jgi:hypothetical protein
MLCDKKKQFFVEVYWYGVNYQAQKSHDFHLFTFYIMQAYESRGWIFVDSC